MPHYIVCVCIYIYIYITAVSYIYIYIYIHTHNVVRHNVVRASSMSEDYEYKIG